jgi:hypothetical protein
MEPFPTKRVQQSVVAPQKVSCGATFVRAQCFRGASALDSPRRHHDSPVVSVPSKAV